jgi:D-aminopeptidase
MANGSGDYVVAFSTARECRRRFDAALHQFTEVANPNLSPLFAAVVEATEEAIYNSMFRAKTVKGFGQTVEALPLEPTLEILQRAGVIKHRP